MRNAIAIGFTLPVAEPGSAGSSRCGELRSKRPPALTRAGSISGFKLGLPHPRRGGSAAVPRGSAELRWRTQASSVGPSALQRFPVSLQHEATLAVASKGTPG